MENKDVKRALMAKLYNRDKPVLVVASVEEPPVIVEKTNVIRNPMVQPEVDLVPKAVKAKGKKTHLVGK